ncbi:hypothetical protein M2432_001689 [Mycobacterium sp. OTB74]|nr:hypothetical protein [Mycobacterium sp. OTB74]
MTVPAITRTGSAMPVRAANASSATAETSAASSSPVPARAAINRAAGSPASSSRRSAARAERIWKYIARPDRNAAAQPAVTTCRAGPILPPNKDIASASERAATTTKTSGTSTSTIRLTGLRT